MNSNPRAALLVAFLFATPGVASTGDSLGWRELHFVTQDDWSVHAVEAPVTSEEAPNRLARLTVEHHGRKVGIPRRAFAAIDDPIISGIKVVNVAGPDAIRIEIPLLQTPELHELCRLRVWEISIAKDSYVEARARDEPDPALAELCD
jgi:hypothetical protein